jgi:signal transduction histidine kinase
MSVKASFFSLTMLVLLSMIAFEFYNWKEDREEAEALAHEYAQEMSQSFKQLLLDKTDPYRKQTLDISTLKQVVQALERQDETWFDETFGGTTAQFTINGFFVLDETKKIFFHETSQPFLNDLSSLVPLDQLDSAESALKHFFVKCDEGLVEFFIAPIYNLDMPVNTTNPAKGFLIIAKIWDAAFIQQLNNYAIAEISFGKKIAEPYTIIQDFPLLGIDGKPVITLYLSTHNHMGKILDEAAIQDLKLSFAVTFVLMVVFTLLIMKFISLPLRDIMMALEHKTKVPLRKYLLKENEYGAIATELCESFDAKHALEDLNQNLEAKIHNEVENSRLKDRVLFQQAKFAAIGEMLSSIAHQWRQPLSAISVVASKIYLESKMEKLTRQGLEEEITKLQELISHMSSTIDDYKDFFSFETEKVDFSLRKSIEESLKIADGGMVNRDIVFCLDCPHNLVIHNFKKEFSHVLLVLLNNAKEAIMQRHVAHGTITIKGLVDERGIVVEVFDNGGGVEALKLPHVFDPFFTTKEPESGKGTGLYVAKQMIEQNMKGSISVRNEGYGFVVTLVLPEKKA